jgi:exodeoxyribonuclease VII small subunit
MTDGPDFSALSFEDALRRLETIVQRLESGEASLEESIELYGEGDALRRQCEERLKAASARIEQIQLGQDGRPAGTQPFDDD